MLLRGVTPSIIRLSHHACYFCIEGAPKCASSTKTPSSQTDTKHLGNQIHGKRGWQQVRINLDLETVLAMN